MTAPPGPRQAIARADLAGRFAGALRDLLAVATEGAAGMTDTATALGADWDITAFPVEDLAACGNAARKLDRFLSPSRD